MTSKDILYSKGKNDECYTPAYGVKPILKYIPENWTVWCPFDTKDSEFVKQFKARGNKVIATHIRGGRIFLLMFRRHTGTVSYRIHPLQTREECSSVHCL